ncbi:MAG: ATP-grasp domain-containing protein [Ignavibacteria bacterium]|nr:ATP-grasp domain-containing protein [Ignavibacteria bacterium]
MKKDKVIKNKSDKIREVTVALTGLNAIDSPGPGVAVIRCLKEMPDFRFRIIGLSYEALEPGIYMNDIVDKTYQIPYPSAGTESLFNRIKYINEKENLGLIIPNFDAELYNFIKLVPKFEALGIKTFFPAMEQFEKRDKINLFDFCKKNGFLCPRDKTIVKIDELKIPAGKFGFPLVIKGKYYEAAVAHSFDAAQKAFLKISSKWGLPIIVQEFIKGTEINLAAIGDGNGNTIGAVPVRKLYITDKGKSWAGITLEDKSLIELAEKFIAVTKWRGGFELEIMRTPEGKPYIMEINPRFPAWIYLSSAAGQNHPAALVRMAFGEKVKPYKNYRVGKIFIRYSWDLVTDVEKFQKISAFGEI